MNVLNPLRNIGRILILLASVAVAPVAAQADGDEGLLVIYGAQAPTREGDTDYREQIFFSVPANTDGRFFVRLFDPEIFGDDDFTYGGPADSVTTFRVFGGEGAFNEQDRPVMVEDHTAADAERPRWWARARTAAAPTRPG